jgi:hypothetical protein
MLLTPLTTPAPVSACEYAGTSWYNPTGWQGCEQWGTGQASMWGGPGAASNDCLHPWTDCAPRIVISLDTGRSLLIVPVMFCGCFVKGVGPNGETARLIDLDPSQVAALGLDASQGLFAIRVEPATVVLPDTAVTHTAGIGSRSNRAHAQGVGLGSLVAAR